MFLISNRAITWVVSNCNLKNQISTCRPTGRSSFQSNVPDHGNQLQNLIRKFQTMWFVNLSNMPNFTVLTISLFCMCSQPSQPQVENLVKEIRGLCQEAQVFCSTSKLLCAYSYLKKRIGILQTIIDVSSSCTTFHYMQYHANWCLQ